MRLRWTAAAVVLTASAPAVDAFAARTPTPPGVGWMRTPSHSVSGKGVAKKPAPPKTRPPGFVGKKHAPGEADVEVDAVGIDAGNENGLDTQWNEQIEALQSQLSAAQAEAARWRDEYRRALSENGRIEEEKLKMQLEAIASIDELRAEYDGYIEESQSLIVALQGALDERAVAGVGSGEGDATESEEDPPVAASEAMNGEAATGEASSESGAEEAQALQVATGVASSDPMAEGTELREAVNGEYTPVDGMDGAAEDGVAAEGVAVAGSAGSDPAAEAKREDLELTRQVIMDFVLEGTSGEEDAFVLKTVGNVDYVEKLDKRATKPMSLKERLASMDRKANGPGQGGAAGVSRSAAPRAAARTTAKVVVRRSPEEAGDGPRVRGTNLRDLARLS